LFYFRTACVIFDMLPTVVAAADSCRHYFIADDNRRCLLCHYADITPLSILPLIDYIDSR